MNKPDHAWFSSSSLCAFCLCLFLLPGLHCTNLLCYYCPLQPSSVPCSKVFTECLPGEKCFTAAGRYGSYSGVISKGCVSEHICLRTNRQTMQGNNISLGYSCCSRDYCNSSHHWTCNHWLLALIVIALISFYSW